MTALGWTGFALLWTAPFAPYLLRGVAADRLTRKVARNREAVEREMVKRGVRHEAGAEEVLDTYRFVEDNLYLVVAGKLNLSKQDFVSDLPPWINSRYAPADRAQLVDEFHARNPWVAEMNMPIFQTMLQAQYFGAPLRPTCILLGLFSLVLPRMFGSKSELFRMGVPGIPTGRLAH